MQKVKLVQFSLRHKGVLNQLQKHVPVTRKVIEVYKKDDEYIAFNQHHRPLVLDKVVNDPQRKDRKVIWCENYEMDEDLAYEGICNHYREQLQIGIDKGRALIEEKEAQMSLSNEELFKVRKGG